MYKSTNQIIVLNLLLILSQNILNASTFTVINTNDSGLGSLRQAILDSNATSGTNTIEFNISGAGPFTISPNSALPTITNTVTINGYSQPGAKPATETTPSQILIELDGTNTLTASGLDFGIGSNGSAARGLAINRFTVGINLLGNSNIISGNYLGTDTTGTIARPNTIGIQLVNSSNNIIGGSTKEALNLTSGNNGSGIALFENSNSNKISGNFVGTDITGTKALPNLGFGITLDSSNDNIIGGSTKKELNLTSGNNDSGISIFNSDLNKIIGNLSGTDITGNIAIPNLGKGLLLNNASNNIIGGSKKEERNIFSGNNDSGIAFFEHSNSNKISGNFVGTDITGTKALPNLGFGITLDHSNNNIIGGSTKEELNLISGNNDSGISIFHSDLNKIIGNLSGTDITGTIALPNLGSGLLLNNASNNIIGGSTKEEGNIFSGNAENGVIFRTPDSSGLKSTNNLIIGNIFGTDLSGSILIPNKEITGVGFEQKAFGQDNIITCNRIAISGESKTGIKIDGVDNIKNKITTNSIIDVNSNIKSITLLNGGNDMLAAPILQTAKTTGQAVTITGILNGNPATPFQTFADTAYRIEFFVNDTNAPEGKHFIGFTNVTTDSQGNAAFNVTLTGRAISDQFITATAIVASGSHQNDTSEFSNSVKLDGPLLSPITRAIFFKYCNPNTLTCNAD